LKSTTLTRRLRSALRLPIASLSSLFLRLRADITSHVKDTLSDRRVLGSYLLLMSIVGLSAMAGYLIGQSDPRGQQGLVVIPANFMETESFSTAPTSQSGKIQRSEPVTDGDSGVIADQLGQLRAELLRLHSVFVHLAEQAELEGGEFDLQSPLLDWQELSSIEQVGLLKRRIAHMTESSSALETIFDIRRIAHDQRISGRPLMVGSRTSGFGFRTDPITGESLEHRGLDFSGPVGEPILALADGIVTFSGDNAGYGNLVEIEHVDGLLTRYAHNQTILVKSGARVKKGETIATLGSTGRSTGPHVHIEVRLDGAPIDPAIFIR